VPPTEPTPTSPRPARSAADDVAAVPLPAPPRLLRRGLARRCAVCGGGHLFSGWFRMAERCGRCGIRFRREEGSWSGDIGMNTIVTFTLLFAVLLVGALSGMAIPTMAAAAAVVAIGVPVLFLPFSKTLWFAVDVAMRPPTGAEVDPVWLAEATGATAGATVPPVERTDGGTR
jgi:uncharacterized protein (DUF983 family)